MAKSGKWFSLPEPPDESASSQNLASKPSLVNHYSADGQPNAVVKKPSTATMANKVAPKDVQRPVEPSTSGAASRNMELTGDSGKQQLNQTGRDRHINDKNDAKSFQQNGVSLFSDWYCDDICAGDNL